MKGGIYKILFLLSALFFVKKAWAYDLTITSVGALSTLGINYSLVNVSGGIPTLTGTASPSAQVGVKIKTSLGYATASTSGVWQYVPSSLDQGDNTIVVTSGTQSISFVLRFNSTTATVAATPAALPDEADLPDAGVWTYYLIAVLGGLGVYLLGVIGKKQMHKWEKGD